MVTSIIPGWIIHVSSFGKNAIRTADGDRDDGLLGLDRKDKPTFLEFLQAPVRASGAFGKDDDGSPVLDFFCCLVQAFQSFSAVAPINGNIPRSPHGRSQNENLEEFLLGQPTKLDGQFPQEGEDVKPALMV